MILSDNETKLDLLNNRAIAKTIVDIIKDSKESVEPLFVALPGLLIQAAKKDPERPLEYNIFEFTDDEVDRYNRIIFENGDRIVAKNEKQITDLWVKRPDEVRHHEL